MTQFGTDAIQSKKWCDLGINHTAENNQIARIFSDFKVDVIKGVMTHYFLTSKNNGPVLLCTATCININQALKPYPIDLCHTTAILSWRFKKLCFCMVSLAVRTRLAVQIQSFFNLWGQNGCWVTKVYCLQVRMARMDVD